MDGRHSLPFLDTTVVRGLLFGTHVYRKYLRQVLGERWYVGRFVDMEFKRGVLLVLIDFYNLLAMSHIKTISDAHKAWGHKFQTREVKLLEALTREIFDKHRLDGTNAHDKRRGLMALATYIKSLDRALRSKFKNPSSDRTHCARGAGPMREVAVDPDKGRQDLNAYADQFKNAAACRKACRIEGFFSRFRTEVMTCVQHVESLAENRQHKDLRTMGGVLRRIRADSSVCSCAMCDKTGDAVICVGAPRQMQVNTTDQSFPHWCQPIQQPHNILVGEHRYLNELRRETEVSEP